MLQSVHSARADTDISNTGQETLKVFAVCNRPPAPTLETVGQRRQDMSADELAISDKATSALALCLLALGTMRWPH